MTNLTREQVAFKLESPRSVASVSERLQEKSAEHSFRVLAVHDVQQTLAEKGFPREPLIIVEICNAGFAHKALQKDNDISMFLPCRYSVYAMDDHTEVCMMRPTLMTEMLPESGIEALAAEVESTLKKIMAESV